jgi:transcriptional regulator with XRE-family HTH domain
VPAWLKSWRQTGIGVEILINKQGVVMPMNPLAITIRAKRYGVLIRNARLAAGRSLSECAEAVGGSVEMFEDCELGKRSLSLPELEILAYYLQVPLEHFWGHETLAAYKPRGAISDREKLVAVRQRMVGAILRQSRLRHNLTLQALAEKSSINSDQISAYELGRDPIPLTALESLAAHLDLTLRDFQDTHGPIGLWTRQQHAIQNISEYPEELLAFISKPVNRPYLELAQRLSEMSVEKLRSVAEGLLEITL